MIASRALVLTDRLECSLCDGGAPAAEMSWVEDGGLHLGLTCPACLRGLVAAQAGVEVEPEDYMTAEAADALREDAREAAERLRRYGPDRLVDNVREGLVPYAAARAVLDAEPVHAELAGCGAAGRTTPHLLEVTCQACLDAPGVTSAAPLIAGLAPTPGGIDTPKSLWTWLADEEARDPSRACARCASVDLVSEMEADPADGLLCRRCSAGAWPPALSPEGRALLEQAAASDAEAEGRARAKGVPVPAAPEWERGEEPEDLSESAAGGDLEDQLDAALAQGDADDRLQRTAGGEGTPPSPPAGPAVRQCSLWTPEELVALIPDQNLESDWPARR